VFTQARARKQGAAKRGKEPLVALSLSDSFFSPSPSSLWWLKEREDRNIVPRLKRTVSSSLRGQ